MMIRVVRPGLQTTVQDLGRPGHQHEGIPEGGAMDSHAARIGNLLVGNDEGAATLEIAMSGPVLIFEREARVALTGADVEATVDGASAGSWRALTLPAGSALDIVRMRSGCRCYMAVEGGIDVEPVLGSRSTYLPGRFGGYSGRALKAGDVLSSGTTPEGTGRPAAPNRAISAALRPTYGSLLRLIPGEDMRGAGETLFDEILNAEFRISGQSDRMGYRLEAPMIGPSAGAGELPSAAVTMGTLQLPPSGEPILLMADRQTTGGYPVLGHVATVDLGSAAQLRPGDRVRFARISTEEAQRLYLERERTMSALRQALILSP